MLQQHPPTPAFQSVQRYRLLQQLSFSESEFTHATLLLRVGCVARNPAPISSLSAGAGDPFMLHKALAR